MPEKLEQYADDAKSALEHLDPSFFESWQVKLVIAIIALLVLVVIVRKIRRALRRRRPVRLHPKLQKYGEGYSEPDPELVAKRRMEARRILATSSTSAIAGYEIIEQVEAIHVDGFRRTEDALEGLKAMAAMKGANAVTNVRQALGASGKYAASGDAVIIRKTSADVDGSEPRP